MSSPREAKALAGAEAIPQSCERRISSLGSGLVRPTCAVFRIVPRRHDGIRDGMQSFASLSMILKLCCRLEVFVVVVALLALCARSQREKLGPQGTSEKMYELYLNLRMFTSGAAEE